MKIAVKSKDLKKSFGDFHAVQGVTFEVPHGQCVSLLGPNGAGKTTTLKMIMGLLKPTDGELTILGKDSSQIGYNEKKSIGLVPQDDNLDPDLTVEQNLKTYGQFYGLKNNFIEEQTTVALDFVSLNDRRKAKIGELSGGMRRRISFARALISDPDLVILDEPTTGLDPQARHMLWQKVRNLKSEGKTILLTTHYMDEAERLSDLIILVDHGKVIAKGSPRELIKEHVEPHVFEADKPLPKGMDKYRLEDIGESVLIYADDLSPEKKLESFHHRPANLEDVFLKLTGRSLRESN